MFETIFMPVFLKTIAITCGIGIGSLAVLVVTSVLILATSPIANKIKG